MDLFAFFKFYFYTITGNKKRTQLVTSMAMFPILVTPVVLFIIHMMTSFVVLFYNPSSMVLTYTMPIWIPVILFNMIYANLVRDKFWKDEREKLDREAQARREQLAKEREAERMYNAWREHMRKQMDEEKKRKERRENIHSNAHKVNQNRVNALKLMGLNDNSSEKDIKLAYKRLAKVHHPDLGGKESNFIKLKKAYDYLMNK
jgi:hypothetical protein